jgi:phosphotriesterase-related protein
MHIVTNTGDYGAMDDSMLLPHDFTESADELATRGVKEWEEGIGETGIKPGFIKTGVDAGPLSDVDRKLVQAAARTHLQTGLMIHCHTGEAEAALEVLATVIEEGVDPSALVVVHAADISDWDVIFEIVEAGAIASLDHVGSRFSLGIPKYADLIEEMIDQGFGDQIVLSHDTGWYDVNDPEGIMTWGSTRYASFSSESEGGNNYMHFAISDELVPELKRRGVTDDALHTLLVMNPARAFAIEIRSK